MKLRMQMLAGADRRLRADLHSQIYAAGIHILFINLSTIFFLNSKMNVKIIPSMPYNVTIQKSAVQLIVLHRVQNPH